VKTRASSEDGNDGASANKERVSDDYKFRLGWSSSDCSMTEQQALPRFKTARLIMMMMSCLGAVMVVTVSSPRYAGLARRTTLFVDPIAQILLIAGGGHDTGARVPQTMGHGEISLRTR
jgi:hypothetical protein